MDETLPIPPSDPHKDVNSLLLALTHDSDREKVKARIHAAGAPVYTTHPKDPGKVVEVRADGTRTSGTIEGRRFVPDSPAYTAKSGARITLIHLTKAIPPVFEAFREGWPEAEVVNLLDDGLTGALEREGGLTPPIVQRIRDLATYAARSGADGILFTCSAFTPAMDACSAFSPAMDLARQDVTIPLLKPDEAMFAAAFDAGRRIGVVATFPGTIPVAELQIRAMAAARGVDVKIVSAAVPEAFKAMNAGDTPTHDRLVADAAADLAPRVDVICLAQFSMARAHPEVQRRVTIPVLTSPSAAVHRLRTLLGPRQEPVRAAARRPRR